jgi:hypothetical protein
MQYMVLSQDTNKYKFLLFMAKYFLSSTYANLHYVYYLPMPTYTNIGMSFDYV